MASTDCRDFEKEDLGSPSKPSPLDRPFTLGALVDHPIPPEALPTVLEAWAQYRKGEGTFTIREALWFSRLSGILREFQRVGDKDRRNLANLVLWYSVRERAYEAIGETIDTADLDTEVLRLLGLIEREQEEGGATPWIVKDGQLMDGTGKIRGQLRVTTQNEDGSQPWGQKEEGGTE